MKALLGALASLVTISMLTAGPAEAQPTRPSSPATVRRVSGTFSGTASADVVRANLAIPDFLIIEDFVDGGGPSAQAVLDSLGTSQGFASFPYPGELGVSATGLVSLFSGLSLPSYPFIAQSSHPTQPETDIDQPGIHLGARSTETSSESSATFGEGADGSVGRGHAVASVMAGDDGRVTASSRSTAELGIGPVALRGVRAEAEVTRTADGAIEKSSSLAVGEIDVGGIGVSLTDRGLVLAGTPLVPIDVITGLTSTLSIGEATIEFVPESETEDSVISAGLRITTSQMIDAIGRPVEISYTLGQAFATANGAAFPVVEPTPPLPEQPAPAPAPAPTAAPSKPAPAAPPVPAADPSPTAEVAAPVAQPVASRTGIPVLVSTWAFYPVLVLAGAVLCSASLGARRRR